MKKSSRRVGRIAAYAATPLAILAAATLIFQSSYAAFNATTRNSGNSWSTGQVDLTNDSNGSARFNVSNMVPGQTDTKCISVTANATVPGVVKGYVINPITSTDHLENYIFVTASEGTGGGFGSCSGYTPIDTVVNNMSLATLFSYNSYATGLGNWSVAGNVPGGETRTYQITWTFNTTGLTQDQLNSLQGDTTGLDFQWELQSS
jgi:hypothetical protein